MISRLPDGRSAAWRPAFVRTTLVVRELGTRELGVTAEVEPSAVSTPASWRPDGSTTPSTERDRRPTRRPHEEPSMRHALTTRFVIVVTALLLLVVIAWAGLARIAAEDVGEVRVDEILAVDPSIDDGRDLFVDTPGQACASCHSLAAASIDADDGPPIDELEPAARTTIESLVSGTVPVHDEQGYGTILSNQQIADLAAYLEDAVDAERDEADEGEDASG